MSEPTDIPKDLKEETLHIAFNSGLGQLIDDLSTKYSLIDFEKQSIIPISTDLIAEGEYSISISQDVKEHFDTYQELINEEETAFEFPFLITGKTNTLGKLETTDIMPLNSNADTLNNDIVKMSSYSKLLAQGISEAKTKGADIFILGHTHPIPNQTAKQNSLTEKITTEDKNKFHIKELGLNLSLQDLYQLVYFQDAVKGIVSSDSKIFLSVLMFNGEMNFISVENGMLKKSKIINNY